MSVSCSHDHDPGPPPPEIPGRVILVYMGGDNSLSSETYEKRKALCQGWQSTFDGELFLYCDPGDTTPSLYQMKETKGEAELLLVSSYPEENSASSAVFSRVINEVVCNNPARSYGLLVFSHASGWLPQQTFLQPRSIIIDGAEEMELRDLAAAMPDEVFDFIIFEACFMAGIEVAYELKNKTEYIVASSAEIVSPGFTPVYGQILDYLYKPKPDLMGVVQTVYNYYSNQTGYLQSATYSVIHTPALEALEQWIRSMDFDVSEEATDLSEVQHFDRYASYRLFFDLEDYYTRLLTSEAERKELERLIKDCVPYKVATNHFMEGMNGFEIRQHSGLTTYIPQKKFPYLNEKYQKLKWKKMISD